MVYILCHEYGAHRITFRELLGRFSVITRTVFENTNCKLKEWFKAISLMFHSKKGLSALRIHWMLGTGSYETAWFMCQRIRPPCTAICFPLSATPKERPFPSTEHAEKALRSRNLERVSKSRSRSKAPTAPFCNQVDAEPHPLLSREQSGHGKPSSQTRNMRKRVLRTNTKRSVAWTDRIRRGNRSNDLYRLRWLSVLSNGRG
jgi:hypothetical protein